MGRTEQPNVVLVTIDCLRADVLSLFGYDRPTTPNLESVASRGTLYEQCFANGVMTGTSFPSLMVSNHRQSYAGPALPENVPTLANAFAAAGYSTAGVVAANPNLTPTFGYDAGFDTFVDFITADESALGAGGPDVTAREPDTGRARSGPELTDRVVEFVRDTDAVYQVVEPVYYALCYQLLNPYRKARNYARFLAGGEPNAMTEYVCQPADEIVGYGTDWIERCDRPFFLWLHLMDPHSWYAPADEHVRALGYEPQSRLTQLRANRALISASPFKGDPDIEAVDRHLETLRTLYDGAVRQVDAAIGVLDTALDELGLTDETVLAITSDHGEEFLEHGSVQHGGMPHTALTHVPLVLRGPGVPTGRRQSVVELTDVPPTLLTLAGIPVPDGYRGTDVSNGVAEDSIAISARYESSWTVAAREDRYTLLYDAGERRLYDRQGDYHETAPLDREDDAWDEAVYTSLSEAVDAYIDHCSGTDPIPDSDDVSAEVSDRLEKLGYK